MYDQPWSALPLTAIGVKISGDDGPTAIVEIATVPLINGRLQPRDAYHSIVKPDRFVPPRPSIPPGLENDFLALGPSLQDIQPELVARLHGRAIVCHDTDRTWKLLAQHYPAIEPVAVFDTLRLAQAIRPEVQRRSLTALLRWHELTDQARQLASGVRPHRALWDAVGVGLLLPVLIKAWSATRGAPSAGELADASSPLAVCP
ncbi:3'-5' exonuclease [Streptosporangium sp. NPDC001681]|uniref:3'-5' exonuclease n=1 Tax=Streptosporangium sp. NPDC001681 TaxID=3154395 RepID=UPI003320C158